MILRTSDRRLVLAVVPGDRRLSMKKMAAVLGDKDVDLAKERDVERVTGFRVGSVSVLGFRRDDVATYIDQAVLDLDQVVISSGRPDAGLALSSAALIEALEGAELGDYSEDG
jgi:Cys-tRNA(Pro)/Cys-tRNA(Cys) deacylase